jgi:predicted DCC family thiol-disulfide oxidoreductase YuxK
VTAAPPPILFFDGTCGLCARAVVWCMRHDRRGRLRYAPLQGATYAALSHAHAPRDLDTVVLADADGVHVRSDAVLRVLGIVGGAWAVLGALGRAVPRPLREAAYRAIARRRLGWFGTADACAVARAADRARLLD